MNGNILGLKIISSCLILILMFVVGYSNFVITWGLEVKSWLGFFGFFILSLVLQSILQVVLSIKVK